MIVTAVGLLLGWLLAILFVLLAISMLLTRNWINALVLLLLTLLVLPPASAFAQERLG